MSISNDTVHLNLTSFQHWVDDSYFERISLKQLGLRIQLGHKIQDKCRNSVQATGDDFVVIDINGIHDVGLDFCNCETSKPHFIQLLRYGLYPASLDRPKTAATFTVLKHFQLLNFESKASMFEFYNTLVQLSDNTGLSKPKVCYPMYPHMGQVIYATHSRIDIVHLRSWFESTVT